METDQLIATEQFCSYYNVEYAFIESLEEVGLIETVTVSEIQFVHIPQLHRIERIMRLHEDLNINLEGLEAIERLLDKMGEMNTEIVSLRNRLRLYER